MRQPSPATRTSPAPAQAVESPTSDGFGSVLMRTGAFQWLNLSSQRSDELAAELGQFAAATLAVSHRLRFDSEPADWNVSCARWQQEPR